LCLNRHLSAHLAPCATSSGLVMGAALAAMGWSTHTNARQACGILLRYGLCYRGDRQMSQDRVIIFDTTLLDGEQSPGASMTREEKLRIAKALEKLRVDVIEAGFAIASPGDFEAVKGIADTIQDSTICSLARAVDADID